MSRERLTIRLSADEKALVTADAASCGESINDFAVGCLLAKGPEYADEAVERLKQRREAARKEAS